MADFFRGQGSSIARALLLALLIVVASPAALAQLYDQPVLIIDPGMHTAPIRGLGVDAAGRIAVTGAEDKTLRVWSVPDGELLRTIRTPAGPGDVGKIFAVAVQPDGALVAAGGWTRWADSAPEESIYLFEPLTGKMAARIAGVPNTTVSLAFSPDGRYLAAGFNRGGLRVYDRQEQWREVVRDTDYGRTVNGVTFSADGRLATTSLDGKVRLYDRAFRLLVPPKQVTSGASPTASPSVLTAPCSQSVTTMHRMWTFSTGIRWRRCRRQAAGAVAPSSLLIVTWSKDGRILYAGGSYREGHTPSVLAWANGGRGPRSVLPGGGSNAVAGIAALPDGRLLVAAQDPFLELLEPNGMSRWEHASPNQNFRNPEDH